MCCSFCYKPHVCQKIYTTASATGAVKYQLSLKANLKNYRRLTTLRLRFTKLTKDQVQDQNMLKKFRRCLRSQPWEQVIRMLRGVGRMETLFFLASHLIIANSLSQFATACIFCIFCIVGTLDHARFTLMSGNIAKKSYNTCYFSISGKCALVGILTPNEIILIYSQVWIVLPLHNAPAVN